MSEYQQCPLCQQTIHADAGAFDFHVNKCLDHSAGSSVASTSTSSSTTSLVQGERCCSVCRVTLDGLRVEDQLAHVQACKSMRRTSATTPSALSQPRAWLKHKTSRPALRLETAPSTCPHCQRDVQHAVGLETHARTCTGSTAPEEEKNNGVEEQHSTFRLGHKQGGSQRNTSQSSTLFSAATTHHPAAAAAEPVPAVYGLLPILQALLEQSHASNSHPSLSSTLCSPHTAHVAVGMSDALYGCGYRCCQMLYSSLRHVPAFASHLASAASFAEEGRAVDGVALPTMKQLQQCIESAWDEGYDPAGRAHFDGRLVHRRKWIGTTELFVLFTYLGLPARIVDFPKSSDALGGSSSSGRAHLNMIRWVTRYFDQASTEQASSKSPETPRKRMAAFDVLMGSKGEACKLGHRQPLFLQHQGHSRVVVGVEKGKSEAETTLLLFDPAMYVVAFLCRSWLMNVELTIPPLL